MVKYCQYCGKELQKEADVCLNCGKKISKKTSNNQNANFIIKIVLLIVAVLMLIPLISIVIAIFTPLATNSVRHHNGSDIKKRCCHQYDGVWKENTCKDSGIIGVEFDSSGYYDCISN